METEVSGQSEDTKTPYDWVQLYRAEIEQCLESCFSVPADELALLLEEKDGAYWSEKEPNTLCCLVVGKKNGLLYLVTGEAGIDRKNIQNFKCSIVA